MAKFAADDQRAQLAQSRTAAARWLVQAPLVTQEDRIDGSTQELETYKAASGLAHRTDLVTFFDYYEVDEGRRA